MSKINRKLAESVIFGLENSPIVFVNGPRQSGKTTLAHMLSEDSFPADYVSFDNLSQMSAAASSPSSFVSSRSGSLIIDEVQLVPEIFRALKIEVDKLRLQDNNTANGRFLLTGSANILALPKLSDPLVGRMTVKTLLPLAGCEALATTGSFIESLFQLKFKESTTPHRDINELIRLATYPEISGKNPAVCDEWFEGYLTTILQRDVRIISELDKISLLPVLLRSLATRAGSLNNDASIARDIGLNPVTSKSYRGLLQAMFLSFDLPPWFRNIGKRLIKASKGYLMDSLLLCHLLGVSLETVRDRKPELYGHIIENFVAVELKKLLSFGNTKAKLHHFRTSDNKEVDFVLEQADGTIAAVEVKTSDNVDHSAFKGLRLLQELTANDFAGGIVLYGGNEIIPFGEKLLAVPISALWA